MTLNDTFGVDLNQFLAENRLNSQFYRPIERTGDLVEAANRFRIGSDGRRLPEFYIAPPRIAFGRLAQEIATELNGKLLLENLPTPGDVVSLELADLLEKYGSNPMLMTNVLKEKLASEGLTGAGIAAARKLNESRLDNTDRGLLAFINILMYTFYRAAIGLDVRDAEGIVSNALSSLGKIKSYINRELAKRFITERNLEITDPEMEALQDRVADLNISYVGNDAFPIILEEYQNVKGQGNIIEAVNDFLNSGLVMVPSNINRDYLIQSMISFLRDSGFNLDLIIGLQADFDAMIDGAIVSFTDRSVDDVQITEWLWEFGDGTSSTDQNPIHTYSRTGMYTVKLLIKDGDGNEDEKEKDIAVVAPIVPPTPDFSFEVDTENKLVVQFTDQSTAVGEITARDWDFGDKGKSTLESPVHAYKKAGTYLVTLKVTDNEGLIFSVTKPVIVGNNFFVKGSLEDPNGNPLPGLRVQAVDKDPGDNPDDPLGNEVITDNEGRFVITYKEDDFVKGGDEGGPDLVITVLDSSNRVLYISDLIPGASTELELPPIVIDLLLI